jgi:hypothetical protein
MCVGRLCLTTEAQIEDLAKLLFLVFFIIEGLCCVALIPTLPHSVIVNNYKAFTEWS